MGAKLNQLLQRLIDAKVEMVLVGGYAAIFHGSSLMTEDVDIAINMAPTNLRRLYEALKDHHLRHRVGTEKRPFEESDAEDPHWKNLYLMTDLGQLDCLGNVKGVGDYHEVLARSEQVNLRDDKVWILKIDALIDAKTAVGRPKDIHAVRELEAVREMRRRGSNG